MKKNQIEISNKVIELDQFRPTKELTDAQKLLRLRVDLERAKLTMGVSLVSLVMLVTVANQSIFKGAQDATVNGKHEMSLASETVGARITREPAGIATVNHSKNLNGVSSDETVADAVRINKTDLSSEAKIGRRPSSLDQLTFVELDGKYAIRMQSGKVREIEYAKVEGEKPKFISDRISFLKDNAKLLPVNAHDFELESVQILDARQTTQKTIETYSMLSGKGQKLGVVTFEFDRAGRFIGMRLTSSQVALQM